MLDWRTHLKRNWLYMLTGALLSVFLWVAVSADTVSQEIIPTDLVIIEGDRRYVLTEQEPPTDVVSVVFTGRAGDLAALSVSRPQLYVTIDSVESLVTEIGLTPEMIRGRGGRDLGEVRAISVRPNRLRFVFQLHDQKVVPVVPRLRITFADGYMLADSVRSDPSVVAVEGPEAAVANIDSVSTSLIVRERLRETVTLEAPLEHPDPAGRVNLSSSTVRIRIPVEQRAERLFPGIPVRIIGASAANLRVEPALVDIRLRGPRGAVDAVRPDMLSPVVQLTGPEQYGQRLPLTLRIPGSSLEFSIEPDSARVVRPGRTP